MSSPILTRWAIVLERSAGSSELDPDGRLSEAAVDRWSLEGLDAYLARCPRLTRELDLARLRLAADDMRIWRRGSPDVDEPLLVGVGVPELRPSSFDLAVRVRALGGDADLIATARRRVQLRDPAGMPVELPEPVREELIASEREASEYC